MAPDAYLDASVAIVKGEERSGMDKTGCERKRCLSWSKLGVGKGSSSRVGSSS